MAEISIIVPVYNVENKIMKCLDSLKGQSFRGFEVLLINDGSTDFSGKICEEYVQTDNRFQVFHLQNSGVSNARNYGLQQAKGKYIAFVDSDDYVDERYLETLYTEMKDGIDLAISGVRYCTEGSENTFTQKEYENFTLKLIPQSTKQIAELIDERRFNYVYAKLYKTKIIRENKIEFIKNISLGEDTIFVMDYLKSINAFAVVGKAYYNYIKYKSGTLTTKKYNDIYAKYTVINNYIHGTFDKLGILDGHIKNAIYKRAIISAKWAIDSVMGDKTQTKQEKIQAIAKVLSFKNLQESLSNYSQLDDIYPDVKLMRKGSAKKLVRYYRKIDKREIWAARINLILIKTKLKKAK